MISIICSGVEPKLAEKASKILGGCSQIYSKMDT